MPPRYAYWTILIDNRPTAFRARDREELLPTAAQLRRTNTDVVLKWFARGRVWDSREAELEAQHQQKEKRDRDWRPGGTHQDPRQRFRGRPDARKPSDRPEGRKPTGPPSSSAPSRPPSSSSVKPDRWRPSKPAGWRPAKPDGGRVSGRPSYGKPPGRPHATGQSDRRPGGAGSPSRPAPKPRTPPGRSRGKSDWRRRG